MGYIFETEIETIINTVRSRTIGEDDSIELRKVLTADIHPAIKAYFKNEVDKFLHHERLIELRSKKFPYALSEVISLQKQIDMVLINRYEFVQEDFLALLDEAVHFHFNYLCRPQWTLQSFVFEKKRKIGSNELLRKMRYCSTYSYFPKVIQRYVSTKGVAEISYEEFKEIIKKIDRAVTGTYSAKQISGLLRSMLSFILAGIPNTSNILSGPSLPINAAIVFFEDKERFDIMSQLESERDKNGVTQLSIDRLSKIIESVQVTKPEIIEEKTVEATPPEIEIREVVSIENQDELPPTPVLEIKEHVPTSEIKEVDSPVVQEEQPRKRKKQRVLYVSIEFTNAERKSFVRKLFKKEEGLFDASIDTLSRSKEWKDASLVLDRIFIENGIDPFSKDAIRFTDRVWESFQSGGK